MIALTLALVLTGAPDSVSRIATEMRPYVVTIVGFKGDEPSKFGTGFFLDEHRVVTALHVITDSDSLLIKTNKGATLSVTKIISKSYQFDLALLEVANQAPLSPLSTTTSVEPGDAVVLLGTPMGLEYTVSSGIVAAVRELPGIGRVLQTTAPMSQGSSGGPLVNMAGEVIGVAVFQFVKGQNLNFAVPIGYLATLAPVTDTTQQVYAATPTKPVLQLGEALVPNRLSPIELESPEPISTVSVDPSLKTSLLEAYQFALKGELLGKRFPDEAAKRWKAVQDIGNQGNPFFNLSRERRSAWAQYARRKERHDHAMEKAEQVVRQKLQLSVLSVAQKVALLAAFAEEFGQVDVYRILPANQTEDAWEQACFAGVWEWCLPHVSVIERTDPIQAFRFLFSLCSSGYARACGEAAMTIRRQEGLDSKNPVVGDLVASACTGGYLEACKHIDSFASYQLSWLQYACDRGDLESCSSAASSLSEAGRHSESFENNALACKLGYLFSCHLLAGAYWEGAGVKRDREKSISIYQAACKQGATVSCTTLGFLYESGEGVQKDRKRALGYYDTGCSYTLKRVEGSVQTSSAAEPCYRAGELLLDEPTKNTQRAADLLDSACGLHHRQACFTLGILYQEGSEFGKDDNKAVHYLEAACGDYESGECVPLAYALETGVGVAPDFGKAARLYSAACSDDGNSFACFRLGLLHQRGSGVPLNQSIARGLFSKSCVANNTDACFQEALMSMNGDGGPRDYSLALALNQRACEAKNWAACHNAGVIYERGLTGNRNLSRARGFYNKACDGGVALACTALKDE